MADFAFGLINEGGGVPRRIHDAKVKRDDDWFRVRGTVHGEDVDVLWLLISKGDSFCRLMCSAFDRAENVVVSSFELIEKGPPAVAVAEFAFRRPPPDLYDLSGIFGS